MSIYIVRGPTGEEIAAYTDPQRARLMAEQLRGWTREAYQVVELRPGTAA